MALPYRFFINPFLSVTADSYKNALSIGVDHEAKLIAGQADPDIANLLLSYQPVLNAFRTVDENLDALLGNYKAKTQTVESLFEVMNEEKLPFWEAQIFYFYTEGTEQATALFPNKRKPFQEGTYEQRIKAIKVLGTICAVTPNLGAAAVNILAFHTQIESARLAQQSQGEGAVAAQRSLRESARILLCKELYGNMGALMRKFRDNPVQVGDFYDMELLRSQKGAEQGPSYNGTAPVGISLVEPDFGEEVELTPTTKFKITHLGEDGQLTFYFSDTNPSPPMPPQFLMLEPGDSKTPTVSQLGYPKAFFLVQNSGTAEAEYSIEIVEE